MAAGGSKHRLTGQMLGFNTEEAAAPGEPLIPGDGEVNTLETIGSTGRGIHGDRVPIF